MQEETSYPKGGVIGDQIPTNKSYFLLNEIGS